MIPITFLNLLTLLFVGLKLSSVVTWSWWLILTPTFVSIALIPAVIILVFLAAVATGR